VIKESVRKVLRETSDNLINRAWDKADDEAFEYSCERPNFTNDNPLTYQLKNTSSIKKKRKSDIV
jgi:hypothetical protein